MECLVCGGPAEDITSHPGLDAIAVDCPKCKPYEVARSVLDRFGALDSEGRAAALRKAKRFAAPGTRSAISSTSL
jgi:hypothetical protein